MQEIDYNLFWSDLGEFRSCITPGDRGERQGNGTQTNVLTLEEWQAHGYDVHSVFADPLFVDEANGDYRLKPESPALELGFESFSLDGCGLLPGFPNAGSTRDQEYAG